jgi:hypothetical protein
VEKYADLTIYNDGTLDDLRKNVIVAYQYILEELIKK